MGRDPRAPNNRSDETPSGRTAKHIAFGLIGLYGTALATIGVVAAWRNSAEWIDLFKSGFLILGGSLTTVVGYYFGSRGVQDAEANAIRADLRAQAAERRLQEAEEAPTYSEDISYEDGMIEPEEYAEREAPQ